MEAYQTVLDKIVIPRDSGKMMKKSQPQRPQESDKKEKKRKQEKKEHKASAERMLCCVTASGCDPLPFDF
jgi:hypothetical protein